MSLILASSSPRRKEILENAGISFELCAADVDETIDTALGVSEVAESLAVRKAKAVADKHPDSIVLGADTIVVLNGQILGKPKDEADAASMLRLLAGKTHTVYTGVCIAAKGEIKSFTQATRVKFYDLTHEDINAYIQTGEPMDKAGAYGIQGRGCLLIEGIEGDYFNVVGLPIARVVRELGELKK